MNLTSFSGERFQSSGESSLETPNAAQRLQTAQGTTAHFMCIT